MLYILHLTLTILFLPTFDRGGAKRQTIAQSHWCPRSCHQCRWSWDWNLVPIQSLCLSLTLLLSNTSVRVAHYYSFMCDTIRTKTSTHTVHWSLQHLVKCNLTVLPNAASITWRFCPYSCWGTWISPHFLSGGPLVKVSLGTMFLGPVAKMTATDYGPEMVWWLSLPSQLRPHWTKGRASFLLLSSSTDGTGALCESDSSQCSTCSKTDFIFNLLSKIQSGYLNLNIQFSLQLISFKATSDFTHSVIFGS